MSEVIILHSATAFNAAADVLLGADVEVGTYPAVLVWFTPGGSYDGTATFQVSPDDGSTWFAIDGRAISTIETPINALASPGATTLYIIPVPSGCRFRVAMSGGTQGTLTVEAARVYFNGV